MFLSTGSRSCPARDFLGDIRDHADLIQALGMTGSLDKGYRKISTGQTRKLMLLAQITRGVSFLVIQAPFDGLDPDSCRELDNGLFPRQAMPCVMSPKKQHLSGLPGAGPDTAAAWCSGT